jgi:hypothetical protein
MTVQVIKRYADAIYNRWVEVGEQFEVTSDRAAMLQEKGFIAIVSEPSHVPKAERKHIPKAKKK